MASRIIYEWGTCTGAIRRLRFEIVSIEIMQHMFVVKYFCCYRYGICIWYYRYELVFKIRWNFRFHGFVMKDIANESCHLVETKTVSNYNHAFWELTTMVLIRVSFGTMPFSNCYQWCSRLLIANSSFFFPAISWREQVNFQWDDDEVRFELVQHTYLDSIVLAHWNNSPRIDISPYSDTYSWFRADQSSLFLFNAVCLPEKQQIPIW